MTNNRHPYEIMSENANAAIDRVTASNPDVSDVDAAHKLVACQALIAVIEQGVKIAGDFMRTGEEPYPGAALDVVKTTQRSIALARLSKLVP